jgi:TonB family protein
MLSILAAMLIQAAAPAATPATSSANITEPNWITKPSAAEFAALYPSVARKNQLEGHATLHCQIDNQGALQACSVAQEEPADAGFGDAALRMAFLFRMRPLSKDGVRTAGGEINLPIRFKLPEPMAPATAPPAGKLTIVDRASWLHRPTGENIAQVYPEHAQQVNLEGNATIRCGVGGDGYLTDCAVLSEDPAGEGFGAASLKLSKFFRMAPATKDGAPVAGGQISIPIRYKLPGWSTMKDIVITRPNLVDSSATVDCRAQAQGIDNCLLTNEDPKDSGAGALAMQLAPHIPSKVSGSVRFQVRFVFKKGLASR